MTRPSKDDYVKFSIDGVKLRDVERFDAMAKECFPESTNPRKDAFHALYWNFRSIRDLAGNKLVSRPGDEIHGQKNN